MKRKFLLPLVVVAVLGIGCITAVALVYHPSADKLAVQWQPVDHSVGSWQYHLARLTIENKDTVALGSSGWKLYFSFVRQPLAVYSVGDPLGDQARQDLADQGVSISRADTAQSGDYYVLEPLQGFVPIQPGEKRVINVKVELWAILKSDAPAGFHVVFEGEPARWVSASILIDPTDSKQTTAFEGDVRPVQTPEIRYDENTSQSMNLSVQDQLLPRPLSVCEGTWYLYFYSHIAVIQYPGSLKSEAKYLESALEDILAGDIQLSQSGTKIGSSIVDLSINPNLDVDNDGTVDAEGYTLNVDALDGIDIVGADAAGVFYGIQTLRQLIPASVYREAAVGYEPWHAVIPEAFIKDAPRFEYRGMHFDGARHFQSKETIMRLLDILAFHKINKFHFHLTDDEGWRLEIPGIPELTDFGARRGFDLDETDMLHQGLGSSNDLEVGDNILGKPADETAANGGVEPAYQGFEQATLNFVGKGSGYYTVSDFEEILRYAAERHIDVIPEIDMPGHARAAVQAMEYRYRKYKDTDMQEALRYRLLDPEDTSQHKSVQGYTDNFVNPALNSTYAFLTEVVTEIKARYDAVPGAELIAIHAGGDELPSLAANVWWQGSPAVQQNPETAGKSDRELADYFFTKWHEIITGVDTKMTGWSDVLTNGTGTLVLDGFIPMPWSNVWGWGREDEAYRFANQGYKVILAHATNLYMDLAYNKDPDEPGYYWANFVDTKKTFEYRPFNVYANATEDRWGNPFTPNPEWVELAEAGKENIWGLQGLLWAENQKAPELVDYFAFPKILGVAERAWNRNMPPEDQIQVSWELFCNTLGQAVLPHLDFYQAVDLRGELSEDVGVNYRIPLPGAKIVCGYLRANIRFPGLTIEYSRDGGKTWKRYYKPVRVYGSVLVRARSTDGRTSRAAEVKKNYN